MSASGPLAHILLPTHHLRTFLHDILPALFQIYAFVTTGKLFWEDWNRLKEVNKQLVKRNSQFFLSQLSWISQFELGIENSEHSPNIQERKEYNLLASRIRVSKLMAP